jgi:hypothetical protein
MSWDAFGAALDDWISGKVAEKKREKGLGAIGTLEKERNASDMYQGAQKRTDEWLASLSPEDLKRVRPDSTRVASNFEGIGDVKNFDLDKRQRQLGLTSEFSTLPEVQNYIKMNDVEKKNKLNTDISTDLQKAAMAISGQRKKQENVDNYKKTGDILSELNITMPQPFSKEGMSTLQSPYMQNVELRKQITSGNDAGFLPIEFQKKDKGYSDLGGKLLNYEPEKPLSNREIWLKYGLNKYDDPRVKDFYEQNVKDPEDREDKRLNDPYKNAQIDNMKTRAKYLEYQMENANPEKRAEIQAELMKLKEQLGRDTDLISYNRDPKPTYGDLLKEQEGKVKEFGESSTVSDALSFVRDIRGDSNGAFGLDPRRLLESVDGTGQYVFKQKVDQLKNLLTLAERGKLKGQGAVSDMETEMLRKASTLLSTKLSAKAFQAELDRIEQYLNKQGKKPSLKPDTSKPAGTTEPPAKKPKFKIVGVK